MLDVICVFSGVVEDLSDRAEKSIYIYIYIYIYIIIKLNTLLSNTIRLI